MYVLVIIITLTLAILAALAALWRVWRRTPYVRCGTIIRTRIGYGEVTGVRRQCVVVRGITTGWDRAVTWGDLVKDAAGWRELSLWEEPSTRKGRRKGTEQ